MGSSNWGTQKYFWDPNASDGGSSTNDFTWFPTVNGYDINDRYNGYAGDFGRAVVALRINKGIYMVHETGGNWLSPVSDNQVTGKGNPIDGVAIKGGIR